MNNDRPGTDYLRAEGAGLRGSVRICEEERAYLAVAGAEHRRFKEGIALTRLQFDSGGRLILRTVRNRDGSEWEARYYYAPAGFLLKTASGMKGGVFNELINEYDGSGRIQKTVSSAQPHETATYSYDEQRRRKKIQTSRPEDYRPNLSFAGSPFAANDRAPNLPGGGTATTLYDERDRPYEIEVRDENGEVVKRVFRAYDEGGNITEEMEILPDPIAILPRQAQARILGEPGTSAEDLRDQISKLMAGQSGPHSVKYEYDRQGRVIKTLRRIFDREDTIETFYNSHGDVSREITRGKRIGSPGGDVTYSEAVYSYKYDRKGNWIEKIVSHRIRPDGPFEITSSTFRVLTYY